MPHVELSFVSYKISKVETVRRVQNKITYY